MEIYIERYDDRCTIGGILIHNGYKVSPLYEESPSYPHDIIEVGLKIERIKEEENET